jgi:hypothetical protein
LKKYLIIGILVVTAGIIIGVWYSVYADPAGFWKSFRPNLLANVIGVSVAVIIGIPVGIMVNQFMMRHHLQRDLTVVRDLLEEVKKEITGHANPLVRLISTFVAMKFLSETTANTSTAATSKGIPKIDMSSIVLVDVSGKMFVSNQTVIAVREIPLLIRISIYYSRVSELNNLLKQSAGSPLDMRIDELANSIELDRAQLVTEVEQAIRRLTGSATTG